MKKVQKEVKTYKNIYVSVDGKEFELEEDCKAWEKSYRGTLEASWRRIKKIEVNAVELGLPWSSDDQECYMLIPKGLDEIALVNAYIECTTANNGTTLTTEHIGKLIVLNFGCFHDYCEHYTLDNWVDDIKKYIDKKSAELEG